MAEAIAAVKLGSFVKEEAICWTKNCWKIGDSTSWMDFLALSYSPLGSTKSRVTVGVEDLMDDEMGGDPRLEPNDNSA